MNSTEIEFAVRALVAAPYDATTFPFDLIAIYNTPKVTVSKLKSGQTNAATSPNDVLWKKRLFFRAAEPTEDVGAVADVVVADNLTAKHKPRFVFVTNGTQVHIRDLVLNDTCNAEFGRLDESSDFLLPLAGFERRAQVVENPADVKAAKRLAKLYDAILAANPTWSDGNHTHELNLFMTRVLFCFYAEDTGLFQTPQLFTNTVSQHTDEDGADVAPLLDRLFTVMNVKENIRPDTISAIDNRFPYVNGSLFENMLPIPTFNRTARRLFIECGELDWKAIHTDIFGSMIQTIAEPGARGDLGMHYTSVPNILKVLKPLFLDDLHAAYDKSKDSTQRLEALLVRLSKIRVFDPACGSGNFLVIAYKELRALEMRVLERISQLSPNNPLRLSGISLHNFYGIDLVDFACETAKLSLWIVEYQQNALFKELFGTARPPLPLGKISTIHNGNALRLNWLNVCPRDPATETYLCGNPPYVGYQSRTNEQKEDLSLSIGRYTPHFNSMDYICGWFILAAAYARGTQTRYALVSTNSICQGEQVAMLWPVMFALNAHIDFAYTSFKWANSAARNAGVSCVIIGMAPVKPSSAKLITGDHEQDVAAIGPYLIADPERMVVTARRQADPWMPLVQTGCNPTDGGNLLLTPKEKDSLLRAYPEAGPLVRRFVGSNDLINSIERYCLWISDEEVGLAESIPPVRDRIEAVAVMRRSSPSLEIRESASIPYRFRRRPAGNTAALVIPHVSSERRHYLTVALVGSDTIVNNSTFAIYDPPAYLIAVLSSRMHFIWNLTVGGKLESRLRYSNTLVYNTFPVPKLSDEQESSLADHSRNILRARAKFPGKSLAWLYNPETMPTTLLEAHRDNDAFMEQSVYGRTFKDDTKRLEHLFAMYARLKQQEDAPLLVRPTKKERL